MEAICAWVDALCVCSSACWACRAVSFWPAAAASPERASACVCASRESLFGLGKLLIICRDLLLLGRDLPGDAAAAGLLVLQLLLHAGDVGAVVLDLGLQEGDVVLGLLAGGLELADGLALVVELEGLLVILQAQLLGTAVEGGQLVVCLLEDKGGGGVVGLGLAGSLGDLFEVFRARP